MWCTRDVLDAARHKFGHHGAHSSSTPVWQVVEQMLAAVAGIMTWITLHELLPAAFAHAGREGTIVSFFLGAHLCS